MDIFHLLYVSNATSPLKQEEINHLLSKSSKNNKNVGVTGMLIYRMGFFIQLLEGEESSVRALYTKIEKDSRHRDSSIVLEFTDNARLFPQWYMGVISEALDANELFTMVKSLRQSKLDVIGDSAKQTVSILKTFSKKYLHA